MIKKILLFSLGVLVISILGIYFYKFQNEKYFEQEQEKIANILGVDIEDYPPIQYFPYGYFDKMLIPGMSIEEVHQVMKGYVTVYTCGDMLESYNYISDNDHNTLEFVIIYNESKVFKEFVSEDRGYHVISPECVPGQVE